MNPGNSTIEIRKRDMNFDFSGGGRLWNGNSVFLTVFFNSLSIMLPEGESYMIKVARKIVSLIEDDKKLFHWPTIKSATKFFFTKFQIFPTYLLKYLTFFNSASHPWNGDNTALINDWKTENDA